MTAVSVILATLTLLLAASIPFASSRAKDRRRAQIAELQLSSEELLAALVELNRGDSAASGRDRKMPVEQSGAATFEHLYRLVHTQAGIRTGTEIWSAADLGDTWLSMREDALKTSLDASLDVALAVKWQVLLAEASTSGVKRRRLANTYFHQEGIEGPFRSSAGSSTKSKIFEPGWQPRECYQMN